MNTFNGIFFEDHTQCIIRQRTAKFLILLTSVLYNTAVLIKAIQKDA